MGWIDVHHHILPPAFVAAQREEILYFAREAAVLDWSPSRALEQLDRFGIDTAFTSLGVPGAPDPTLARACPEHHVDLLPRRRCHRTARSAHRRAGTDDRKRA